MAGLLLTVLVLLPLQLTAAVLWLVWQRRIRQNAALLPGDGSAATRRRLNIVGSAAVTVLTGEAALYAFSDPASSPDRTAVALELAQDLLVLGLLVAVGITTSRWTREQDRKVRHGSGSGRALTSRASPALP